ncbi:FkbM family methyltransferase [Enterovirga aerilata]|uniref:FkbM family methyltransferase n=1 Tax=Enterovirga aerilata TaxID=2730920 RepID=A0A849HZZ8_9HYPH|nr:FkbM family methyltransferase [Enterovirga sp. DB1703]NNM70874.1 FkbM family methyltransferase [Enterovirga sp. DB1703]
MADSPIVFAGIEICHVVTRYGRMAVPARDAVVGHSLRTYGEWAEHEIQSICNHLIDGGTIIDVGANIGTHSLAYSARLPKSTLYSFEPQMIPFELFAYNVVANAYSNILPHHLGCGAAFETVSLSPDYNAANWNLGSVGLREAVHLGGNLPNTIIISLDEVVPHSGVQLLKVDAEGMEAEVFAGALRIIAVSSPLIYFEISQMETLRSIIDLVAPFDYVWFWHETSAFNLNNFNLVTENVWSRCEIGVIGCPASRKEEFELPQVTGTETSPPTFHDPKFGFRGDTFCSRFHPDRSAREG